MTLLNRRVSSELCTGSPWTISLICERLDKSLYIIPPWKQSIIFHLNKVWLNMAQRLGMELTVFKCRQCIFAKIVNFSHWKRVWPFIWIKLESLLHLYVLCQFWLYLASWFWRMSSIHFHFIAIISLRERTWLYFQETWITLSKDAFGKVWLKWTQWFWRKDFLNVVNRACPFIWRTYIPFAHGCFVPSLVNLPPKNLEKKIFQFCPCNFAILLLSPVGENTLF